ncbi:MAG: hypothetical protein ACLSE8_02680 [Parasutterella sp.]
MRVLAASLLFAATLLQGCTLLGIASTTASISSPKHGWFDVNAKLVEKSEIRRPAVPLNLTLHLRVIVQGVDTGKEGTLEDSFEWLFADETRKEMVDLLEKNGIALITDRGLDGAVYIEISDTMEDIGMRYLPIIPTVRWTEREDRQDAHHFHQLCRTIKFLPHSLKKMFLFSPAFCPTLLNLNTRRSLSN